MGQTQGNDWPEAMSLVAHNSLALRNDVIRLPLGRSETEVSGANRSAMIDNLMEWAASVLLVQGGSSRGSAHGGASPPLTPQGPVRPRPEGRFLPG